MEEFAQYLRARVKPKADEIRSVMPKTPLPPNMNKDATEQEVKELEDISKMLKIDAKTKRTEKTDE